MSSSNLATKEEIPTGYPVSKSEYQTIKILGRGSYGYVVLAKCLTGEHMNEQIAIKILDLDIYVTENWETIEKELSILRTINHPNLICSLQTFVEDSDLHLVMPYMNGGSCSDILRSRFQNGFEDEVLVASILKETLKGIIYLHEDGRIHRDVKSGNILLSRKGDVKLADFGVSRCLIEAGEKKGLAKTFIGTPCWMAPEVMQQEKGYDYKADIWSFGITALEMAFGKPPYSDHSPMKVLVLTLENNSPSTTNYGEKANKFSRSFKSVIDICLKKKAVRRPTAKELLKQKFFKKSQGPQYIMESLFSDSKNVKKTESMLKITTEVDESSSKKKAVSIGNFTFEDQENKEDNSDSTSKSENKSKSQSESQDDEDEKKSRFIVEVEKNI